MPVITVFVLLVSVFLPVSLAGAVSQNEILVNVLYDGTPDFDADSGGSVTATGAVPEPHTPGLDAGANNNVVRTHDQYALRVDWNINEDEATGVAVTVVLPDHSVWLPDDTGMFSGCDPTLSTISADGRTLVCELGDQLEGSNGVFRPIALLQESTDDTTFTVDAVLTTDDDTTGVTDTTDQELTVSEAPSGNWIKQAPEISDPVTVDGVEGYVVLFPLSLIDYSQGTEPVRGAGPIATTGLDLNDHFWGAPAGTTVATAAQMTAAGAGFTGRTPCGAYDGTGTYPVTGGTWTCGTATTPNSYPVVPISVAGYTIAPAPALNADGTPNQVGNATIAAQGQIGFWLPKTAVDDEIANGDNDSPTSAIFENTIGSDPDTTAIASQNDVTGDAIPGTSGPAPETSTVGDPQTPDNNTRHAQFGIGASTATGPGATVSHNIRFRPGPLQLIESSLYGTPRLGPYVAETGMGWFPGNYFASLIAFSGGDRIGETPRGATITIDTQVLTSDNTIGSGTLFDAPISGCVAFDTAHYTIKEYGPIDVAITPGVDTNNPPITGGYTLPGSNTGILAHVETGAAGSYSGWRAGQRLGLGDLDYPYTVEFTDAPVQYHSGASFGADEDQITCDNGDAGDAGWVDATDTAGLAVFDTVDPGDGLYEGITKARIRITEPFSWERTANGDKYHGIRALFQAEVKADLSVNTVNQELHAMMSHTFGEVDPATGVSNMLPYDGFTSTNPLSFDNCRPYSTGRWEANGNQVQTSTGWCNNLYQDDGTSSFDTTDLVDWDNNSWHFGFDPPNGGSAYELASGDMIKIVEANLGLSKTNVDGVSDVTDNGDLAQFTIRPSVVGSTQEALTNVRLSDNLPSYYHFVRFVSGPSSPGATCNPPATPDGTITCQFSEPNPATDTGLLPAGLPGGWSDEFTIEVEVVGATADANSPVALTNSANVLSSGLGPWDPDNDEFIGEVQAASKSKWSSARSFMPLASEEGAVIKAVDTLEGPCTTHPTMSPVPADWADNCSLIALNDNMSFTLSFTNEGNTDLTDLEIVDVFPHNADETEPASNTVIDGVTIPTIGDGRTPQSVISGTLGYVSLTPITTPSGSTVTTWVTSDDPSTISRDADVTVGNTINTWCDTIGGTVQSAPTVPSACPMTPEEVTATYTLIDGPIAPNETVELQLTLDSEDDRCNDVWTNTFGARTNEIGLPIRSNDVTVMTSCEHDLNLKKTVDPTWAPGADWITPGVTTVPFLIEVTNEADIIEDFDVTDYIDTATWTFDVANNPDASTTGDTTLPYTWDASDPTAVVAAIDGPLQTDETVTIPVVLTIENPAGGLDNVAEISRFDTDGDSSNGDSDPDNPNNPASGPIIDTDSTPDATNDDPLVDDVTDNSDGDEDDHDIASIPFYDLELIKTLGDPAVDFTAMTATFDITVNNQSSADVYGVTVAEYAPVGLAYNPTATQALWTTNGLTSVADGSPVFTIDTIPVNGSVTFPLVFDITDLSASPFVNAAEISGFDTDDDPTNEPSIFAVDVDSTPDDINDDDAINHNENNYDADGDGNVNEPTDGDEDDHDYETLDLTYSVGNQVWYDTNNNGQFDAGEISIEGVTVELFTDADGDGLPDDTNGDGVIDSADAVATTTTDADGAYLFDGLAAGDYIIGIAPSNWNAGGPLEGFLPSTPVSSDANDDVDDDNNGAAGAHGYVWATPITLGDAAEPAGEPGHINDTHVDVLSNLTVDFGFWEPALDLTIEKTLVSEGPFNIGDNATFALEVTNTGNVTAANIEVIDQLPASMKLNDANWTENSDNSATTVIAGPLAPEETTTVEITVEILDAGGLENTVGFGEITAVDANGNTLTYPDGNAIAEVDTIDGGEPADNASVAGLQVDPPEPEPSIAFTGTNASLLLAALATLLTAAGIFLQRKTRTN